MRWVVAVWFVLGACAGRGPQGIGEAPSCRQPAPRIAADRRSRPVTFAPVSEPAALYNDLQPPVPHTALGDAVITAVRAAAARAHRPAPLPDARLFRACADLAEIVPEDGIAGARLDDTVIEFALQHSGIIEPEVRLFFGWGDVDSPERFVEELEPKLAEALGEGAPTRLGVGVARRGADGIGAIVFALQGSAVSTFPIPRAVAPHGDIVVDAVVEGRFRDPEVFVTYDSGDTDQVELRPGRPGGFIAQIACRAHQGRHQIEIAASDASGSTVLANFPVWCAADPPRSLTVAPAPEDAPANSPAEAEHRLLAHINRDRAAAGLPILLWDDSVAAVARRHSEEMRRTRVVAHISPVTGSAVDRVRAAHITTRSVLENVARAYSLDEAHRALMNSPGHRANILSAAVTHLGIGVALGDELAGRRELFITQVFARLPSTSVDAARCDGAARARGRPSDGDVAGNRKTRPEPFRPPTRIAARR